VHRTVIKSPVHYRQRAADQAERNKQSFPAQVAEEFIQRFGPLLLVDNFEIRLPVRTDERRVRDRKSAAIERKLF
jgi:hypothetical protein